MKLCHIVKYHNVLFKFDNGQYHTMPLRVIALCSSNYISFLALSVENANFGQARASVSRGHISS